VLIFFLKKKNDLYSRVYASSCSKPFFMTRFKWLILLHSLLLSEVWSINSLHAARICESIRVFILNGFLIFWLGSCDEKLVVVNQQVVARLRATVLPLNVCASSSNFIFTRRSTPTNNIPPHVGSYPLSALNSVHQSSNCLLQLSSSTVFFNCLALSNQPTNQPTKQTNKQTNKQTKYSN